MLWLIATLIRWKSLNFQDKIWIFPIFGPFWAYFWPIWPAPRATPQPLSSCWVTLYCLTHYQRQSEGWFQIFFWFLKFWRFIFSFLINHLNLAHDPCLLRIKNLHRKSQFQKSKNMGLCLNRLLRGPCFWKCKNVPHFRYS